MPPPAAPALRAVLGCAATPSRFARAGSTGRRRIGCERATDQLRRRELGTQRLGVLLHLADVPQPRKTGAFVPPPAAPALRARGEPVTYEDLMRPLPPDAENGAHELDRGFQWLADRLARADAEVDDYSFRTHYAGPWRSTDDEPWFANASTERLDGLRDFLDTMGPFYEHLAAAAAEPEIAWPLDPKSDLPNLHSAGFWAGWRSAREDCGRSAVRSRRPRKPAT